MMELRIEGIFYMTMSDGETLEQAQKRFENTLTGVGIELNDSCCSYEEQEI